LQTGVAPIQPGRGFTENSYNVNGARDTMNNFLLDGVANSELEGNTLQIKPAVDALAEFKIQTSMFSAEYGRSSGAIVNAVIKSGTNSFHGALWEFLRNDKLDAKDFFADTVAPLKRNQFGGDIGGTYVCIEEFCGSASLLLQFSSLLPFHALGIIGESDWLETSCVCIS
jgi:hypothetical protein